MHIYQEEIDRCLKSGPSFLLARRDNEDYRIVSLDKKILFHSEDREQLGEMTDFLRHQGYGFTMASKENLRDHTIQDEHLDYTWLKAVNQEWPMDLHPVPSQERLQK